MAPLLILQSNFHWFRMEDANQISWRHFHAEATMAAVDVDFRKIQNAFFDVNRHLAAGSERRCAATVIAGIVLRLGRFAWRDRFDAKMAGEIFRGDAPVAMHQDDERLLGIRLEYKCLDGKMFVNSHDFREMGGAALIDIVIKVFDIWDFIRFEHARRACDGNFRE